MPINLLNHNIVDNITTIAIVKKFLSKLQIPIVKS